MAKTKHIQGRMSQRGIRTELLEITKKFGKQQGDRIILSRKGAEAVLYEVDNLRKKILEVVAKGGLVLVSVEDVDITTFRLDSYRRGCKNKTH